MLHDTTQYYTILHNTTGVQKIAGVAAMWGRLEEKENFACRQGGAETRGRRYRSSAGNVSGKAFEEQQLALVQQLFRV